MTTYNRTITVAASVPTITQDFGTSDSVVVTVDATSYSFGATASVGVVSGNVAVSSSTVAIGSSFTITASAGGAYEVSVFLFDKVGGSQSGSVQGTVTASEIYPASPTASNQSISTSATSASIPISGGVAIAEAYSLCVTPGLTTNTQVVNDRISAMTPYNGGNFTVSGGNLPIHGQSKNYFIYSYRYTAYGGAGQYYYASSFSIFRPFIPPSTSATCSNTTIAFNYSGSLTLPLLNADFANEAYRLCRTGGTKTFSQIAADQIGSSIAPGGATSFTIIDSELPGVGGTEDYTVYAYRYPAYGGQGVYVEAGTFYVARAAQVVTTPTNITFSVAGTASSTTSVTVTASGGTGGTLQVSSNNSTWVANGSSFSVTRGTTSTYYARRLGTTTASSSYSKSVSIPYLGSDNSVTIGNIPTAPLAFNDTSNVVLTISGRASNNAVRIVKSTASTVSIGIFSALNNTYTLGYVDHLPDPGTTINYLVQIRRAVGTGGDGIWREDVSEAFSISRDGANTTPNAFDLGGPVTGVGASVSVFSNTITVSGINAAASISVSGTGSPAYSKNGGAFTSSSGTVVNGDTVQVRVTSSASSSTSVTATLNIGGVTDTFTATTAVGGGAGSEIPSGSSDYGIEIRGPDGGTKVLSPTTRYGCAMGQWDTFTLTASGTAGDNELVSADMTGLTTSNSNLLILVNFSFSPVSITRESNGFRVKNNTGISLTLKAVPIRF